MGAKVALAALISAGLLIVSVATAHAVLLDSGAEPSIGAAGTDNQRELRLECAGVGTGAAERGGQAWNTASWLIGLSLVLAISRRNPAQPVA